MPDFPIVDSHVHLYDVKRLSYGWLKNVPKIARTYLLADFDKARAKVAVDKLVFAEVWVDKGLHLQEAAYVQEMADADPRLCGMVAHLPVEKGGHRGDLVPSRVQSLRHPPADEIEPTFCLEPDFIAGVKLVGNTARLRHLREALGAGVRSRAGGAARR
jgi:L-fuconolactonase